jgi:hypothetical protein
MLTHDGLQVPLGPNRLWQLIGVAVLAGGVAWCFYARGAWLCPALTLIVLGLLVVGNQVRGVTRVRVTFSKLLVEDERPVMGFLIGPSKRRIPWEELQTVEIVGDKVVAKGKDTTLELGATIRSLRRASSRSGRPGPDPGGRTRRPAPR